MQKTITKVEADFHIPPSLNKGEVYMKDITWLILGILAVWRVTHMLSAENGPFDIFARLRSWLGEGALGNLMDCFLCLSVWVAAPAAALVAADWKEGILMWLAMSAGAIWLERFSYNKSENQPAVYYEEYEEREIDDELLRKSEKAVQVSGD